MTKNIPPKRIRFDGIPVFFAQIKISAGIYSLKAGHHLRLKGCLRQFRRREHRFQRQGLMHRQNTWSYKLSHPYEISFSKCFSRFLIALIVTSIPFSAKHFFTGKMLCFFRCQKSDKRCSFLERTVIYCIKNGFSCGLFVPVVEECRIDVRTKGAV